MSWYRYRAATPWERLGARFGLDRRSDCSYLKAPPASAVIQEPRPTKWCPITLSAPIPYTAPDPVSPNQAPESVRLA
jgi:hypothetical protein